MLRKKRRKICLNKPRPSTRRDKKMMVFVRNPRTGRIKTIHFGQKGSRQNPSKVARKKFLARSAGIRDKSGRLTKDNPLKANFWTRRILWGAR